MRPPRLFVDLRLVAAKLPQITQIVTILEKRNLQFLGKHPASAGACSSRQLAEMLRANTEQRRVHVSGKLPETTGWKPVLPRNCRSRAPQVGAGARVDLDRFAFLDEKRNVDCLSGL